MNDLISIIVPVFNVEQYLERCITSIMNQTYHNIEIIMVDDGSTDQSGLICDKYVDIDPRIQVIHQKNLGPSEARNVAISKSIGRCIAFVDADDYVENDYIQYLYELMIRNAADIACCNTLNFKKNKSVGLRKKQNYEYIMNAEEALCQMLYEKNFSNSVWGKLYKREVIVDILFPKGKVFEDMYTTYKFILRSKNVVYGNSIKYYYMKHESSIMSTTKSHDRMQVIDAENELILYLTDKYPDALQAAYSKLFASSVVCLSNFELSTNNELFKNDINILWGNIEKYRLVILHNKRVQAKYKLLAYISFLGKDILSLFYRQFIK